MDVYVDSGRHVYLRVVTKKSGGGLYLTLNGRCSGVTAITLSDDQAYKRGLQQRDLDPKRVAETWESSFHPKDRISQSWIKKILGEAHLTGDSVSPFSKEYQMFYIVNKDGELWGTAGSQKEVDADVASLEPAQKNKAIVIDSEATLATALSLNAMLALGNNPDVLAGGPEFEKFKNKQDGAKQVWGLLELAFNPVVKKAAEKAAAQKAKEDAKAAAAAAKQAEKDAKVAAKLAAKADKPAKAAGAARGPREVYSGKTIKPLVDDASNFRENTWTRFMVEAIITSDTTDEAQSKIDASEYSGRRADFRWSIAKGLIELRA